MRFDTTPIVGLFLISSDPAHDERGFFARLFDPKEFAAHDIAFMPKQVSLSHNRRRSTLRGMHFSRASESKLVHCVRGRIHDVALDLRSSSPTQGTWFATELSPASGTSLFIPPGVAHGYLTMEDESDLLYHIDQTFDPTHAAGVRWNDPAFGILWPMPPQFINARDAGYPDFNPSDDSFKSQDMA